MILSADLYVFRMASISVALNSMSDFLGAQGRSRISLSFNLVVFLSFFNVSKCKPMMFMVVRKANARTSRKIVDGRFHVPCGHFVALSSRLQDCMQSNCLFSQRHTHEFGMMNYWFFLLLKIERTGFPCSLNGYLSSH